MSVVIAMSRFLARTFLANVFFRKSFTFDRDLTQILLLTGISFGGVTVFWISASAFGVLGIAKAMGFQRVEKVSFLLPNSDRQVRRCIFCINYMFLGYFDE